MRLAIIAAVLLGGLQVAQQRPPQPATEDPLVDLVQKYLWPASDAEFRAAEAALNADASLKSMTRERFHDLEEAMRRGRRTYPPAPARVDGRYQVDRAVDRASRPDRPSRCSCSCRALTIRGRSGR